MGLEILTYRRCLCCAFSFAKGTRVAQTPCSCVRQVYDCVLQLVEIYASDGSSWLNALRGQGNSIDFNEKWKRASKLIVNENKDVV